MFEITPEKTKKYSMKKMIVFFPLPGIDIGHLSIQVERVRRRAMLLKIKANYFQC